jgi:hypothetical protein
MVERDPSGDEEDRPLRLKIVKPRKPRAKKGKPEPEKVGVGAKGKGEGAADEGPDAEDPKPAGDQA